MSNPIQWCDQTLNPVVGCSPVSTGCDHCYAARMASRFCQPGEQFDGLVGKFSEDDAAYVGDKFNGSIRFYPDRLEKLFKWRKPRRIFLSSMGDLFHEGVTNEQIAAAFGVVAATPRHTYMILTKRPERMAEWFKWLDSQKSKWPDPKEQMQCDWRIHMLAQAAWDVTHYDGEIGLPEEFPISNLWIGVSVEDQPIADVRLEPLFQCPAAHYFISYEPALGDVFIDDEMLQRLSLVICGAETGPKRRLFNVDWARKMMHACEGNNVPFWFKKDSNGNETLDGVEHKPHFWKDK
jgi:protein gp37